MFRDAEYITALVDNFFKQEEIIKRFEMIEENRISGWEIWLQIEFSYFLCKHSSKPEWYREQSYEYDRRQEKIKLRLKPDFLIRKSGWTKDQYMALEFKQDYQALPCFKKMSTDMDKYIKIRQSNNDLRSVWAVGIFHSENIEYVEKTLTDYMESQKMEMAYQDLVVYQIGETNYWVIIW